MKVYHTHTNNIIYFSAGSRDSAGFRGVFMVFFSDSSAQISANTIIMAQKSESDAKLFYLFV